MCTEVYIRLSTDIVLMCTKLVIDMMILRQDDGKIVIINRIFLDCTIITVMCFRSFTKGAFAVQVKDGHLVGR